MWTRLDPGGQRRRSEPLLESARSRFTEIGMPGWIARAEALLESARG